MRYNVYKMEKSKKVEHSKVNEFYTSIKSGRTFKLIECRKHENHKRIWFTYILECITSGERQYGLEAKDIRNRFKPNNIAKVLYGR